MSPGGAAPVPTWGCTDHLITPYHSRLVHAPMQGKCRCFMVQCYALVFVLLCFVSCGSGEVGLVYFKVEIRIHLELVYVPTWGCTWGCTSVGRAPGEGHLGLHSMKCVPY